MSDTILAITTGSNGYSADQVADSAITIGELLEQLQEVADAWGKDTKVVIHGYGHGATWEPVRGVEEVEGSDEEDEW